MVIRAFSCAWVIGDVLGAGQIFPRRASAQRLGAPGEAYWIDVVEMAWRGSLHFILSGGGEKSGKHPGRD